MRVQKSFKTELMPIKGEIETALKDIFHTIASDYDYEIIEMEVMHDHVRLFVGAKPSVVPSDIV